ncbi:hypothetical protein [Novispirillum itersonii]|uniref:hypothetical protein n=1 Tax=Novispirillum itersonii TaxID=189 RepID=UPI00036D4089|nr:hypothetical protein [Novispirillum itersonii]
MTIPRYHEQATHLLGLHGLPPDSLNPWNRQAVDWLAALMLSVSPAPERTDPDASLPAVRLALSGGLVKATLHINRLAETSPATACPIAAYVHAQAVAMQETPDLTRETILRFINGHLALWEDLQQRRAMPRKVGS